MKRACRRSFWLLSGLLLVPLVSGCVVSSFVVTDPRAAGRQPTRPTMFIDRLPPMPFYSIGIIEVRAPAWTKLEWILDEAVRKGGEVGCDLVVDRVIYRVSYGIPGAHALLAQTTIYAPAPPTYQPPVNVQEAPPDKREFVCGVAMDPGKGAPRQPPPPAPPPAPPGPVLPG